MKDEQGCEMLDLLLWTGQRSKQSSLSLEGSRVGVLDVTR